MALDFESLTEATSGAIGALVSTTILYPLDTCKTKYQAEARSHRRQRYRNQGRQWQVRTKNSHHSTRMFNQANSTLMHPLPISVNPHYKASNKLHGKVALVTGGDSGIGRAVCYYFALEGATVAFTYVKGQEDRDASDALTMIKEAKVSEAGEPIAIPTDLRCEEKCKEVVDEVVSRFGRIDVLVNNAGVQYYAESIEDITEEQLRKTFETNIFAYFFMARHSLKHMKEGSSIINTASVLAYLSEPTLLDYSSTKGAIVTFTRSLALQLIKRGIRVNGVAPGPIWTPLEVASLPVERIVTFGAEAAVDRAGQPYELAPSYVFLASNDCSSYFTGQFLHPNGGMIVNA